MSVDPTPLPPTTTGESPLPEVGEPRGAPYGTILATVALLFTFAALAGFVYYYAGPPAAPPTGPSREQKLADLQKSEGELVNGYGYDPATKAVHIPVSQAVDRLAEYAEAKGKLPFPRTPQTAAKKEEKEPEPKKEPEAKKEEPKKEPEAKKEESKKGPEKLPEPREQLPAPKEIK